MTAPVKLVKFGWGRNGKMIKYIETAFLFLENKH